MPQPAAKNPAWQQREIAGGQEGSGDQPAHRISVAGNSDAGRQAPGCGTVTTVTSEKMWMKLTSPSLRSRIVNDTAAVENSAQTHPGRDEANRRDAATAVPE